LSKVKTLLKATSK